MKVLRQATDIIARVERGDLNHDLTNEIEHVLKELADRAPPKGKIKGQVKLTLNFTVDGSSVEFEAGIESKLPKKARRSEMYFVTQDGALSLEHPQQTDIFDGPREVRSAS